MGTDSKPVTLTLQQIQKARGTAYQSWRVFYDIWFDLLTKHSKQDAFEHSCRIFMANNLRPPYKNYESFRVMTNRYRN